MSIPRFTVVVALDAVTLPRLRQVCPTLVKYHPDILKRPLLCICDWQAGYDDWWLARLGFLRPVTPTVAYWSWPDRDDTSYAEMTQRERMLTAWVKVPPLHVETDYWVKIDADVVGTEAKEWPRPEWFDEKPVLISSPWGYTKPATAIRDLDQWASGTTLAGYYPPEVPPPGEGANKVCHPRIASWISFVDTLWS